MAEKAKSSILWKGEVNCSVRASHDCRHVQKSTEFMRPTQMGLLSIESYQSLLRRAGFNIRPMNKKAENFQISGMLNWSRFGEAKIWADRIVSFAVAGVQPIAVQHNWSLCEP